MKIEIYSLINLKCFDNDSPFVVFSRYSVYILSALIFLQIPDKQMVNNSRVWQKFKIRSSNLSPMESQTGGPLVSIEETYSFSINDIKSWFKSLDELNHHR